MLLLLLLEVAKNLPRSLTLKNIMTHNSASPPDQQCVLSAGGGGRGGRGIQRIAPGHSPCPESIISHTSEKSNQ